MGVPAATIAEAVFARAMSALKDERKAASKVLKGPDASTHAWSANKDEFITAVHDALYCSKICAYAQGFQLMREAQKEYNWSLDFGAIARIWRGGCIIRARFLQKITEAYQRDPKLANLLLDPYFRDHIEKKQQNWRRVIAATAQLGIPNPAFSSALSYYDGYRTERLPASLLQAQRDYFGAHTYERVDHWPQPKPQREQVEV
jgi:6-phosphogluconate dehydrogenase